MSSVLRKATKKSKQQGNCVDMPEPLQHWAKTPLLLQWEVIEFMLCVIIWSLLLLAGTEKKGWLHSSDAIKDGCVIYSVKVCVVAPAESRPVKRK